MPDLRDAVAPNRKADAPSHLLAMQRWIRDANMACVIRVNRMVRDVDWA